MASEKTYKFTFIILIIVLIGCFLMNISLGSVSISLEGIFAAFTGGDIEKETWRITVLDIRLPKAITAILVGFGLSLSGLLMQTLFRNPLSGPFVLGLSSGASLGVALLIMGASVFGGFMGTLLLSSYSLVIAASLGSFLVLLTVMIVSSRVKDTMSILIIGLMFGSITAAIVSVLTYFSDAEELKQFMMWTLGSLGSLTWEELGILASLIVSGTLLSVLSIKSLNAFLLGENYARSLGIDIKKARYTIIIATSLLAGSCTAFVGPIAFIGLAIPHITRLFFNTTNHKILVPSVCLIGGILMLICDSIAQVPFSDITLPINAITSMIGAPVVIWLLVRKRKMIF
ncbi:iron complex transport system permease protein [Kordia periserrulae]|uniref:Iron complex transport system permease protein n=1 Tax=Kordia periserrulae TaxID=701523 RepID=A0A2T6C3J3_9FLAO|nr:iron ABC transporter permease [Kordia periserrulae]PTX62892.1 iron complex transport system permease protein [Kordia periserrulae]